MTNRVIVRQEQNISTAGTYEFQVDAPPGYRVVSGFYAVSENADVNYGDVDMLASYPFKQGGAINVADEDGVYNAWRFQAKVSGSVAVWIGLIAERSDEPDVFLNRGIKYI